MHKQFLILATTCLLATGAPLSTAIADNGAELHEENCISCHDEAVYKRKNRRVTSMDGLKKQVQRCELSLGLKWFEEDINDVAGYLNSTYYQFK